VALLPSAIQLSCIFQRPFLPVSVKMFRELNVNVQGCPLRGVERRDKGRCVEWCLTLCGEWIVVYPLPSSSSSYTTLPQDRYMWLCSAAAPEVALRPSLSHWHLLNPYRVRTFLLLLTLFLSAWGEEPWGGGGARQCSCVAPWDGCGHCGQGQGLGRTHMLHWTYSC